MQNIPKLARATLTAQLNIKMEEQLKKELELLKVQHGVDVQELAREFLRREVPRIKKKLATPA
jgi:hypothetical protein